MSEPRPILVPCYEDGSDSHDAEWWIYEENTTIQVAACDLHLGSLIRRSLAGSPRVREIKQVNS